MSCGFGLAMPLVIINLGGEMVYILEQRLKAQNISAEKSERVLSEVVRAMFSPALMAELFRPQPVYTCSATREVFDRLAHSSIMRLNASSMDKLYDLMTMGFKQQFVRCSQAADLLHVTLNHIEQLRAMVANTVPALELLDAVGASFLCTFGTLRAGELLAVRQQVGRFLQDRRVKVSLFLQNNTQNMNATFRLETATPCSSSPHAAGAAAAWAACERPGVVRYFNRDGRGTRVVAFRNELTERAGRADEAGAAQQMLALGCNVYSVDAEHAAATGAKVRQTLETAAQAKGDGGGGAGGTTGAKSTATAELNLLAKLMGTAAEERDAKPFKLNLFGDDDGDDGGYAAASSGGGVPTIHLDVGQHKSAAGMLAEMKFDDEHDDDAAPSGGAAERKRAHDEDDDDDDDDDLLDLMDSVS